jgi:putative DNA primase/helicase
MDESGRKAFDHLPRDERPQARLVLWNHTTANGCIRLWPDCNADVRLTVGEGVESCLAAARTHWPAWSDLNAGNLKALPLLAGIEALTIVCDHDPAGVAAALEAGARWRGVGREVQVLYPTKPKSDWADVAGATKEIPA